MPPTSFREQVEDLALGLAWSLWTELGLSGWERRHSDTAVDLEPLIVFTAGIAHLDPRLRDESLDWCVSNRRWISAIRVKSLVTPRAADHAAASYGAALQERAKLIWPGALEPHRFEPTGRSEEPDLIRPALIQLELRALVGVSARAEVLRLLLGQPGSAQSAAEIAAQACYSKLNVAQALQSLAAAGVVETLVAGRRAIRYRLARLDQLAALLGAVPAVFPDWIGIFTVMDAILRFAEFAPTPSLARATEARRVLRELDPVLKRLQPKTRVPLISGEALAAQFADWSLSLLAEWARVSPGQPR